jgi:hypothetical protein
MQQRIKAHPCSEGVFTSASECIMARRRSACTTARLTPADCSGAEAHACVRKRTAQRVAQRSTCGIRRQAPHHDE